MTVNGGKTASEPGSSEGKGAQKVFLNLYSPPRPPRLWSRTLGEEKGKETSTFKRYFCSGWITGGIQGAQGGGAWLLGGGNRRKVLAKG